MTFHLISRLVVAVCAVFCAIFVFAPQAYLPLYGVETTISAQFMTRRAAPMLLAAIIILWAASSAPRSALRDAVALGVTANACRRQHHRSDCVDTGRRVADDPDGRAG